MPSVPDGLLRVVSWNLMHPGSRRDAEVRAAAASRLLASRAPDVLLLQEAGSEAVEVLTSDLGLALAARRELDEGSSVAVLVPRSAGVVAASSVAFPPGDRGWQYAAVSALVELSGRRLLLASAHMPWGARAERSRLEACLLLDRHLASFGDVDACVFGADMNTTPAAECFRFLRGEVPFGDAAAFYVDAAEAAGCVGPTQDPDLLPLTRVSAAEAGAASPPPPRRMDAVFCRGWVYGGLLSPVAAEVPLSEAAPASDHAPVVADLRW